MLSIVSISQTAREVGEGKEGEEEANWRVPTKKPFIKCKILDMLRRKGFRELLVWQKAKLLCPELYNFANVLPETERFGMASQIRRAALSVPTNIAEGHGRSSNPDFIRFLYHSLGSIRELETLLEIGVDLSYFADIRETLEKLDEVARMLSSLISKLEA